MDINQDIFDKARLVYKDELSESAESTLYEMCVAAYTELFLRLKDGVSIEKIYDEFIRAAGVLAVAMFVGLDCPALDSFSAGSVTLKKRGGADMRDAAASLRAQAELMLTGYLKDGGFYFGAVRG